MKRLVVLVTLFSTLACTADNPPLMAPPEQHQSISMTKNGFSVEFNPRADILFVMDNSASMAAGKGMEKVRYLVNENIGAFADQIVENSVLEANIGVTTVYDTLQYENRSHAFNSAFKNGELQPLKDPTSWDAESRRFTRELAGPRFVSRASVWKESDLSPKEQMLALLKSTLYFDIIPPEQGGPVAEEILSPVVESFSKDLASGPNSGFYRKNTPKYIITISDAADASQITARQMADFMFGLNEDFTVYIIAPRKEEASCRNPIEVRNDNVPYRAFSLKKFEELEQLVNETASAGDFNAQVKRLDLCDANFAKHLSEIGKDIREKAAPRIITLGSYFEALKKDEWSLEVRYGKEGASKEELQLIENGPGGWTYVKTRGNAPAIRIDPNVKLQHVDGGRIFVNYISVSGKNITNGKAKPF